MKYAVVFAILGIYLAVVGLLLSDLGWLLLWPALSFLIVAAAYAGLGPAVFGKCPDGRFAWWAVALLLPYLAVTWALWHLVRLFGREVCCHEVAPGLWLGRRALPNELPADIALVIDLTAEFSKPRGVRQGRTYLCLPTLDTLAPNERAFTELVRRVVASPRAVYVHCASGHGRSATVAAALLIARGLAKDAKEAEAMLRQARPGVRLQKAQRALLARVQPP
jgi:protein-tyrosine phosphatase